MNLLAVERIKLFSTRSPWFCMIGALGLTVGFASILAIKSEHVSVGATQGMYLLGLMVVMVMSTLAVTTEYRFGTIRTTFQAVPRRTGALLAKTTVVALVAGLVGEVAAFGSLGAAKLLQPGAALSLSTAADWRAVAGSGLVYALAGVMAVAVGVLVRQSAGAVAILLVVPLLVENLVGLIPDLGAKIQPWLPFQAAGAFLRGTHEGAPYSPWGALAYFAVLAAVLLGAALVVAKKRDA
ncbi:ABC transporter permease [Kutzneria viridogrisea]|uniref:ABC transporter permease n=2 Tax=Kutzneria TaxID=43356 RepID=W5WMU0_9PSEU|nr:ABC transporter permease [Kutzneria albida]AHI02091.1 hypothetical protein KALB_8734 [Kutzneria albida DSM 43870]MBA8929348.1 ABC-2 type transport system permease protein [Kutzneria viridogrisea]